MTHLGYIVAAYLAAGLVLGAMAAWVVADLRLQKRRLADLEDAGKHRRPRTTR